MSYYIGLIITLLFGLSQSALAQIYPLKIYSIPQGLSQSTVRDVVQDSEGFLWIATDFGLNRFNGYRFNQYYSYDGLPNNRITALRFDKEENLIIGTATGLAVKPKNSAGFLPFPNKAFKLEHVVNDIFQDHKGGYWISTEGSGLWHLYQGKQTKYTTVNGLGSDSVRVVRQDRDGRLWIGTRNGLTIFGAGDTVKFQVRHGLLDNKIRDIEVTPHGDIWIASRGGLNMYRNGRFFKTTTANGLVNDRVTDLRYDSSGILWIATEDGVSQLHNDEIRNFTSENGLEFTLVNRIKEDREGNIWFGSYGGGLIRYQGRYLENSTTEEDLPHNVVTALASDQLGRVWVGTFGRGIMIRGNETKIISTENGLPDNRVLNMYRDSNEHLWVATRGGIVRFQNDKVRFDDRIKAIQSRRITHMMESTQGEMWIGSEEDGLYHLTKGQVNLYSEREGLASNHVRHTIQRRDGSIWVATLAGVSKMTSQYTFENLTTEEGLINNGVMSLYEDDKQYLWLATIGGISRYDGRSFENVELSFDGKPAICYYITQYGEWYLMGTNQGLIRFNSFNPNGLHLSDKLVGMKRFTTTNGLVSNELNPLAFHIDQQYRFWIGTVNGLSIYNALKDFKAKQTPIAHVDRVIVFDAEFEQPRSSIQLEYNENYVTIEFSAISFEAPELVEYEYRLRGIDLDWQRTSQTMVRYTALPAGEYRFELRARGNSTIWGDRATRLNIVIHPPFWKSWWFIMLVSIGVMAVMYSLYRNYAAKRVIDLERMRIRIASDLHDDVGASLSEIALHADYVQAVSTSSEVKEALQQIGSMSRKIVTTMDDIVWSIDARNDTAGDLTDRMQDYAMNILSAADIQAVFHFDGVTDQQSINVDVRQNIYLIFKEAVNNAAKHSGATKMDISFRVDGTDFELKISDNGKGFQKNGRKSGHGLKNMEMRARRIGATIQWQEHPLEQSGIQVCVSGKLR